MPSRPRFRAAVATKARATRENVTKAFSDLAVQAKAVDDVFIILIGSCIR